MLSWVVTFLVVALIAGILGFGGIAGVSIEIAKAIFFIAIILFLVSAVVGLVRRGRGHNLILALAAKLLRLRLDADWGGDGPYLAVAAPIFLSTVSA